MMTQKALDSCTHKSRSSSELLATIQTIWLANAETLSLLDGSCTRPANVWYRLCLMLGDSAHGGHLLDLI